MGPITGPKWYFPFEDSCLLAASGRPARVVVPQRTSSPLVRNPLQYPRVKVCWAGARQGTSALLPVVTSFRFPRNYEFGKFSCPAGNSHGPSAGLRVREHLAVKVSPNNAIPPTCIPMA